MKNFVDLEHDQLEKQWNSIHEKEKAIEEKLKEIDQLTPTWGDHQTWQESDGPYYLAKAKKELEELKR
jgi:hypothetical protein